MKKLLLVCAIFMIMVITGESLTCNTCRVGIGGKCLFSSTEICSDSQNNCYWGNLSFNISSLISMQTRGCLTTALCNQTETGSLLTAGYTVTRTCCSTDCCNGAESIQLHLTAASVAALAVVWSSWLH